MPVVTISRQFGAAGTPIGRRLAERLGAEFLDRALVSQVAIRAGIPESELDLYDERLPGLWQRITLALASSSPEIAMPALSEAQLADLPTHDRLVTVTRTVIGEAAERGNAVIVGRGAAFILGRRPGVLNVQLHASLKARLRYLETWAEEGPAGVRPERGSLEELCRSVDAARAEWVRRWFGADWMDLRHYDLSIDSGRLGIDRTVELLEFAAREGLAD
jgi:cytidylate kinase